MAETDKRLAEAQTAGRTISDVASMIASTVIPSMNYSRQSGQPFAQVVDRGVGTLASAAPLAYGVTTDVLGLGASPFSAQLAADLERASDVGYNLGREFQQVGLTNSLMSRAAGNAPSLAAEVAKFVPAEPAAAPAQARQQPAGPAFEQKGRTKAVAPVMIEDYSPEQKQVLAMASALEGLTPSAFAALMGAVPQRASAPTAVEQASRTYLDKALGEYLAAQQQGFEFAEDAAAQETKLMDALKFLINPNTLQIQ